MTNLSKYDKVMMDTAAAFSRESYCVRGKVGAVLAKDGRILVTGYNGTVSGMPNVCEIVDRTQQPAICKTVYFLENLKSPQTSSPLTVVPDAVEEIRADLSSQLGVEDVEIWKEYDLSQRMYFRALWKQYPLVTSQFTLHAEENVICYAARRGIAIEGCTLYTTVSPCRGCSKLIVQSGIKRVVYRDTYRDNTGINFLRDDLGIQVDEYKD